MIRDQEFGKGGKLVVISYLGTVSTSAWHQRVKHKVFEGGIV
jgi:hypothetical protein